MLLTAQDQSRPVFIDTHYQSRALDNMVSSEPCPWFTYLYLPGAHSAIPWVLGVGVCL